MANEFLNPIQDELNSEWQSFGDLAIRVTAKIESGELDTGIHKKCSFSWFDELVEEGRAERKIENLYRGKVLVGSRAYFRANGA